LSHKHNHIGANLAQSIRNGDREEFKRFYDQYYPKMAHFARIFMPGIEEAQEVVSDVLYKILKNPATVEKAENLDNYLFHAVKNQALTHLKALASRSKIKPVEDVNDYLLAERETPVDICIDRELYQLISAVVDAMPPKRRTVFMMVKEEGMKYKEVAVLLDISKKTVEVHMSEALREVRTAVRDYLEGRDIQIRDLRGNTALLMFLCCTFSLI
jgi:RNA polymerase sigma-70 factor (ECF subfamily)